MLQVRAAHACAALLCGRRNTCNGENFISRKEKINGANKYSSFQLCGKYCSLK